MTNTRCFVYNQHWHTHLLEFLFSIPLVVSLESKLLGQVAEALLVFRGGLKLHFTTAVQYTEQAAVYEGLHLSMFSTTPWFERSSAARLLDFNFPNV